MTGSIEERGVFPAPGGSKAAHGPASRLNLAPGCAIITEIAACPEGGGREGTRALLNVPNSLTLLRLAMIPLVPLCFFVWQEPRWALVVYLLASVTDVLDGYLARKLNQITRFGKLMDPLADKGMLLAVLICLYAAGYIPLWISILAVVKESIMIVGGAVLLRCGVVIQANWFGKAATLLFTPSVALAFFGDVVWPWHVLLLIVALAAAYVAMGQYGWLFFKALREKRRSET